MIVVEWPSAIAEWAEVWRVLDLSGMTKSVRDSQNQLNAGNVYLNGHRVNSKKIRVRIGANFRLEVRHPSGHRVSRDIRLVIRNFRTRPRQNTPTTENRR